MSSLFCNKKTAGVAAALLLSSATGVAAANATEQDLEERSFLESLKFSLDAEFRRAESSKSNKNGVRHPSLRGRKGWKGLEIKLDQFLDENLDHVRTLFSRVSPSNEEQPQSDEDESPASPADADIAVPAAVEEPCVPEKPEAAARAELSAADQEQLKQVLAAIEFVEKMDETGTMRLLSETALPSLLEKREARRNEADARKLEKAEQKTTRKRNKQQASRNQNARRLEKEGRYDEEQPENKSCDRRRKEEDEDSLSSKPEEVVAPVKGKSRSNKMSRSDRKKKNEREFMELIMKHDAIQRKAAGVSYTTGGGRQNKKEMTRRRRDRKTRRLEKEGKFGDQTTASFVDEDWEITTPVEEWDITPAPASESRSDRKQENEVLEIPEELTRKLTWLLEKQGDNAVSQFLENIREEITQFCKKSDFKCVNGKLARLLAGETPEKEAYNQAWPAIEVETDSA